MNSFVEKMPQEGFVVGFSVLSLSFISFISLIILRLSAQ